jgi:hypothetical protein
MKIIATLTAYHSKIDRNGNTYWAFTYLCNETGKTACGTVSGGESNISSIIYEMNGGQWKHPADHAFTVVELPIREFNRMVKPWKHAGCTGEELCAFVEKELSK